MKTHMKKRTVNSATLALALLAVLPGSAALAEDSGWYIGIGGGVTETSIDEDRITSSLFSSGYTVTDFSEDDTDSGYKLFGGYQFNRNFALEGGYFDLGSYDFMAETQPSGSLSGDIEVSGVNLDLVGLLPLSERFSLLGRAGAAYAKASDTFRSTGPIVVPNPSRSERDTNIKFGVGAQWAFSDRIAGRVEAERYRLDDAVGNRGDIDLYSVSVLMRFGESGASRASAASTAPEESVASAPSSAPVSEIPPAIVVVSAPSEEYCSILDIQFEIDQDEIQLEEQEKLRVIATFLKKYPATTAVIEGHTDNVGDDLTNKQLSQRRADSVVAYLREKHGIAASRLSAVGYGETRPLADNSTDVGKRMNRRIGAVVACASDIEGLEPLPARITMALLIEFDTDKADIAAQYHAPLRKVADYLKANPTVTAVVEGHAANSTPSMSMEISRLRARNVADYLVNTLGIARARVSSEGFGESRRFAYNTSAEGQQENRRVNIVLSYPN